MQHGQILLCAFLTLFKQRVQVQGFAQMRAQGAKEWDRRSTVAATIPQVPEIRKVFPLILASCYCLGLLCVRKEGVRVGRARVSHMRRAEVLNAQGLEQAFPFAHPRAALLKDFDPALEGMCFLAGTHLEGIEAIDGGLQGLSRGVKTKEEISRKVDCTRGRG